MDYIYFIIGLFCLGMDIIEDTHGHLRWNGRLKFDEFVVDALFEFNFMHIDLLWSLSIGPLTVMAGLNLMNLGWR